jgi:hypothetical protein
MAIFDEENRIFLGVVVGIAAAGIVKGLAPAFKGLGRPLAKAAIKSGLLVYETGRETLAQIGEVVEDLVAEVKAERAMEAASASGEAVAPPGTTPAPEGGAVQ